ncbi:MAG: hypothetical protein RL033_6664 [Pseudomonadota bacterium]
MTKPAKRETAGLRERATALRLYGLLARWGTIAHEPWLPTVIEAEEEERALRSHNYRIAKATIGKLKPMADFDWKHPARIDRAQVQELLTLDFISEGMNVVLIGPNAVGKTMIAKNLAHAAVLRGLTTRFVATSDMLVDLSACDGSSLRQRLKLYVAPALLVLDELGYLRYDNRFADILFEVVRQRYERERSLIVTTNKGFAEWPTVFESSGCLVTLIDRLCHRAEIVKIEGESYRLKEATAAAEVRAVRRKKKP